MSLLIYQIFHDSESHSRISAHSHVIPLCVNPEYRGSGDYQQISRDAVSRPQISESRAFYYAAAQSPDTEFIGFTSYRHDEKFSRRHGVDFRNAALLSELTEDKVRLAFSRPQTKAVSFAPFTDMIRQSDGMNRRSKTSRRGFTDLIFKWMRDELSLTSEKENEIRKLARKKYVPYCNAFIMRQREFEDYFRFLKSFVRYVENGYGLDEYHYPVNLDRKGREWGEYCERLAGFYLLFTYGKDYDLAFIDRRGKISNMSEDYLGFERMRRVVQKYLKQRGKNAGFSRFSR